MDSRLVALAEAAERGVPVPAVSLLTGGWLVQGQVVDGATFDHLTQQNLNEQIRRTTPNRELRQFRRREEELAAALSEQSSQLISAIGDQEQDGFRAINLAEVSINGDIGTLEVPAVWVQIETVAAWWITDFEFGAPRPPVIGGVSVSF